MRALRGKGVFRRTLALMLTWGCAVAAHAIDLSPEQQRLLMQQLSPEEQAQALELLKQKNGEAAQQAPEFPQVTKPRAVNGEAGARTAGDAAAGPQSDATMQPNGRPALKPYGYDLFAGAPTTFAPATDIPVPAEYVVGPGDILQVQLFGKDNNEYSLPVNRDGTVNFPGIGPVPVAGLRFTEVKRTLEQRVENQLIGMRTSITLGPLRSIRIFVLGDVQQPGSYTVSGLSTMTNALFVSGGVKLIGSLRNIQLKRNGEVVSRLDLYDLLLRGDTRGDARLQPGDVIFVPPVGATVGVDGEVRRPAIYELKNEKTLADVLAFAGGLLSTAYPEGSQLERINRQRQRIVMNVNLADATATAVQNGDVLRVASVLDELENVVLLSGHVQRPGPYEWRAGMRLSNLIPAANELLPKPDLDYVMIKRELAPDRRIKVISVSLRDALAQRGGAADVMLEPHDEVVVFSFAEGRGDAIGAAIAELERQASNDAPLSAVRVEGRVRFPGQYPLEEGMRVSDLLRAGGHLAEAAYTLEAELTRYEIVNGASRETQHITVDLKKVIAGDKEADVLLQPHDHLNVQELPQWSEQDTVQIFGEVRFPGVYPIRRGETLSAVLARAGGVTNFAYPAGAVFMREELQRREQEQLNLMRQRLEEELNSLALLQAQATTAGEKTQSIAVLRDLSSQLERVQATGRLVIDLPAVIAGKPDADVVLKPNDTLVIPSTMQEVTVIGEVFHPTSHLYQRGLSREEYINKSGGLMKKADGKRVYVVRANGAVMASNGSAWFGKTENEINPGDTIVVPMDVERLRPLTFWTSISQIAYQFGLALAAWNTVGVLK